MPSRSRRINSTEPPTINLRNNTVTVSCTQVYGLLVWLCEVPCRATVSVGTNQHGYRDSVNMQVAEIIDKSIGTGTEVEDAQKFLSTSLAPSASVKGSSTSLLRSRKLLLGCPPMLSLSQRSPLLVQPLHLPTRHPKMEQRSRYTVHTVPVEPVLGQSSALPVLGPNRLYRYDTMLVDERADTCRVPVPYRYMRLTSHYEEHFTSFGPHSLGIASSGHHTVGCGALMKRTLPRFHTCTPPSIPHRVATFPIRLMFRFITSH